MLVPFSLSNPVSRQRWNYHNRPMDTLKVQMGLEQLGFMEPRDDDTYVSTDSDRLFGAMEDFQKANHLEVDGIANPDGPTHQAMNRALSASAAHRPAKPLIVRPIPAADAAVRHKNERDIRVLGKRSDPGSFPVLMAQTLLSRNGEAAAPEVADLLGQIYARNPDMGRKARIELAGVMDETSMRHLDDAARIPPKDREPPQRPLLSDLQAVDEMRDGVPDLDDLEDNSDEPSEEGAPDEAAPDMEWKQEPTLFPEEGTRKVKTSGAIRLGANSQTAGQHGLRVLVKWHPLDANGDVVPTWEKRNSKPDNVEIPTVLPGLDNAEVIDPPRHNPYGWQATITIPPQSTTHGNAGKQHINVYIPAN